MEFLGDRKAYHEFVHGFCKNCGLQDVVPVCADSHKVECRCSNPPCPATSEELEVHHNRLNKGLPVTSANFTAKYDIGVAATTDSYFTELTRYLKSVPPQPCPHSKTGSTVSYQDGNIDIMSNNFLLRMQCPEHGVYQCSITNPEHLFQYKWFAGAVKHIYSCPGTHSVYQAQMTGGTNS